MSRLLTSLINLLKLRGGPQDFPTSWRLAVALVFVFLVQNLVTGQRLGDEAAAAKSILGVGLQLVVLAGLLRWRHCPERFAQTLSALAGAGIAFNLITWVLLSQADPAVDQPLLVLGWFAVFIWSLFVDANIYRHALSITLALGMLVTVLALAVNYLLINALF